MKFVAWVKIKNGAINFSPLNRLKLLDFVAKSKWSEFKLTIEEKAVPKSAEALGYYFAGLIPAIIAHDKNLVHQGEIKNNPLILQDLVRKKLITKQEIDNKHRDIMFTFRPDIAIDLKTGKSGRTAQLLREKDNHYLRELIDEVMSAMEEQGYEFNGGEEFRKARGY